MKSTLAKCVVVMLVAVLSNVPAYATCSRVECSFGPTVPCDQIIYDNYFQNWTCAWFKSNVTIVTSPSAYAQFTGSSSAWLLQEVYVPTGFTTHEIGVQIDNSGSSTSTARLHVEVRTPAGDLLETLEIFAPTDADDFYRFNPADYGGDYVKVEFRYVPGNAPGNADFRVQYVDFFLT